MFMSKWVVDEPVKAVAKKNNRIYIWKVVLFIRGFVAQIYR